MNNELYARYLTYFLVFQLLFVGGISRYPQLIETYYSNGFYPIISWLNRSAVGWIPISIGDLFYAVCTYLFVRFIYVMIRDKFNDPRNYFFAAASTVSILFFFFYMNWGLNYYRIPLAERLEIKSQSYSTEDLLVFMEKTTSQINAIHSTLTAHDSLKVMVPYSRKEMHQLGIQGYGELGKKHEFLNYKKTSVKGSLLSLPLTYMGFAGYLNPFTGEAQVNTKMPLSTYAFTICHEMAHQIGYAAENEANFIGYLASTHHPDPYFKFAGYLTALKYLLSELYKRDPDEFQSAKSKLNPGILKNLKASKDFWKSYENPLEPLFKKSYNTYLKANKQKGGIQSYNYMVNLLLNYE